LATKNGVKEDNPLKRKLNGNENKEKANKELKEPA